MDDKLYDLSLIKSQNEIATHIGRLFTIEELESIDIELDTFFLAGNVSNSNGKSEIEISLYSIEFKNNDKNKKFEILEVIITNKNPIEIYMDIRISEGEYLDMDIKCKKDDHSIIHINTILAKALNFAKHRSFFDLFFMNKHIVDNFADKLSKKLPIEQLEELRIVAEYAISDKNILISTDYHKEFEITGIKYIIDSWKFNMIKFQFSIDNTTDYILLPKTKIGISTISLIIEQAINLKQKDSHSL